MTDHEIEAAIAARLAENERRTLLWMAIQELPDNEPVADE